jgi:hypothetical protein
VEERCTCGAILPEDALFCHKCGKPQREIVAVEVEAPPPVVPPPMPAVAAPPPIGFHNGLAVRIGLLAGLLLIGVSLVLGQVGFFRYLAPVWPVAAGFWAVFVYRRRTGQRLSPMNGAHLGWICGIFAFLMTTIMITMMVVVLSEPSAVNSLRDQWKDYGRSEADLNLMMQALHSPATIVGMLLTFLLLFSVLPAFGGAIGAKLLDRD